ncbi:TrbI/VirB10 family protein [Succinivibrio dextrinosolvens]|uniref:TrbI/VirB10 family protein n=1 Tax=Succinivibrio dextrinosolvens TaxID=83771 RepID=UPI00068E0296|nr:TrbI/VirB10 family protein [Succinivibrio dextrinosolvens]
MFERIRTGQVSKKWGYIITIGASLCILMIVLTGFFFNSPEKTSAKTEVKQYSVESSLKYADKVASNLTKSSNIQSDAKSNILPSEYDVKEAFADNVSDRTSSHTDETENKHTSPAASLESEDYLREYIKYREKGNLLDRNTRVSDDSYTDEENFVSENVKTRPLQVNPQRQAMYTRAKTAPTRVELRFNHDEEISHSGSNNVSASHKEDDNVFSISDERESGFEKENQTLSRYDVFEIDSFTLDNEVVKPKTPFALMQGTVIPAILSTGINSELPGQITAMVTRDIKDSIKGKFLLIPRGSKLLGQYGATAAFGSQRLFLGFNRIIFPNGHSINIGSMPGQSSDGFAGFDADVDNHLFRIISNCFFLSSITTAASSVQQSYRNSAGVQSLYTTQARELSSDVSEALSRIIERNINLAPTLKVQPGYKFTISLTKDIFFKEPYGANHEEYFIKY